MTRRRAILALLTLALIAAIYVRPLTLVFLARDAYLFATGMRGHSVQVDGHRIHYFVGGKGPPLVMVHGVASRAADAALLYPELMRHRRVYALDLLGYGDSEKPRDATYTVAMQAEVVRGFMDAMQLRDADMLGVSLGGWVALKVAAEHPQRVKKLVLVSSAGLAFPTTLRETAFSPADLDQLRASLALQTDQAQRIPTFVLRDFLRRSKQKAWIVRRSMRAALRADDLLDRKLQRVTMPVLLVWGTRDRIVPFSVAASMQREMPHARLVALDGCGHLAVVECRDKALPAITDFLLH
ncbi:MAG TPA: alpha/beta fold hydrolase [Thermoanaerobaculia bacterium]|jgi:pimeloyl-ACP methyl ester carboxylesterase